MGEFARMLIRNWGGDLHKYDSTGVTPKPKTDKELKAEAIEEDLHKVEAIKERTENLIKQGEAMMKQINSVEDTLKIFKTEKGKKEFLSWRTKFLKTIHQ